MKITPENPLERAVLACGGQAQLAQAIGVNRQNVFRWLAQGKLPRTDLTGESDHAGAIAKATNNKVSRRSLHEWTREGWKKHAAQSAA